MLRVKKYTHRFSVPFNRPQLPIFIFHIKDSLSIHRAGLYRLVWVVEDGAFGNRLSVQGARGEIGADDVAGRGRRVEDLHRDHPVAPGGIGVRHRPMSDGKGRGSGTYRSKFEGVIPHLERRYRQTQSADIRNWIEHYMAVSECPACKGARLKPEALAVILDRETIDSVCNMSVKQAYRYFTTINLTKRQQTIARQILKEIRERLGFLSNVGLDYLTLSRAAATLSGGEAQRIRLATQIGSRLVGVLYILDEPSIGLHQRDNGKLLNTLVELRDIGNTVLVVEHDRETIEEADFVVEL